METKLDDRKMEKVRSRCGFPNGVKISAEDFGGGLYLGWKENILVSLGSFSKYHIDVTIKETDGEDN